MNQAYNSGCQCKCHAAGSLADIDASFCGRCAEAHVEAPNNKPFQHYPHAFYRIVEVNPSFEINGWGYRHTLLPAMVAAGFRKTTPGTGIHFPLPDNQWVACEYLIPGTAGNDGSPGHQALQRLVLSVLKGAGFTDGQVEIAVGCKIHRLADDWDYAAWRRKQ